MTLPSTTILPLHSEQIKQGGEDLASYIRELIFSLQNQYEDVAQAVNGTFHGSVDNDAAKWVPVIKDSLDPDTTFTYAHQTGTVLRRGILVDVWFDVQWSAVASGTTAGKMYIDLPYKVAITAVDSTLPADKPFVGTLQPSIFTYTTGTGCVINAISDTFRGEIWNIGSGVTSSNQGSVAAGNLIGYIRYVGQGS